jgi:hypothetical protein
MIEIVPASNIAEGQEKMYQGEVQGYFYIQSGFERNILSQKQANVNMVLNASVFTFQRFTQHCDQSMFNGWSRSEENVL